MARLDLSLDDSLAESMMCHIRVIGGEWPIRVEVALARAANREPIPQDKVAFLYKVQLPSGSSNAKCRSLVVAALRDLASQIEDGLWHGWESQNL